MDLTQSISLWQKFKRLDDCFVKAQELGKELCHDIGWNDLSEDFDDVIDGYKMYLLYNELKDCAGECPYNMKEYEQYSDSGNYFI